jgi:hypothetical protein
VQSIVPFIKRRRVTYGFTAQADVSAHNISYNENFGSNFTVWKGSEVLGEINLPVPGKHNVYNALAATTVALELEVPFSQIAEAFKKFRLLKLIVMNFREIYNFNKILCLWRRSIQRFGVKNLVEMLNLSKFLAKIFKPLGNLSCLRFSARINRANL